MWRLFLFLIPLPGLAADFDLSLAYGQSRDFWQTVQEVQDRTGRLSEIQSVVRDRYGRPDVLYSFLDAAYSYPHDSFDSTLLGAVVVGTRAEALAGGEISNPISPEIQAYASSLGAFSFGLRSLPSSSTLLSLKLLAGLGPEKRLYAQGAEFIDAIPVRSGTLLLAGAEALFLNRSSVGEDFWITTDVLLRPLFFHSTTDLPKSRKEDRSYSTFRWKVQNEWLKETQTFLSSRTRLGILTVAGQNPLPFLQLPYSWDYQQKLEFYPGLASTGGIGAIARLLSSANLPNFAIYGGYFGGALGGGLDLQLGSLVLNASTYGLENNLSPSREKTRLWNASLGMVL